MKFKYLLYLLLPAMVVFSCRKSDNDVLLENNKAIPELPSFVRMTPASNVTDRASICCQTTFSGWFNNTWANFETYAPPTTSWRFVVTVESNKIKNDLELAVPIEGFGNCELTTISIDPANLLLNFGNLADACGSNVKVTLKIQQQNAAGQWVTCSRDKSTVITYYDPAVCN